ncbi:MULTISPECIES: TIGR02281 family clan AA aspartic protease [unclassified Marichromatium]|uniref:retropepsin-like aspartic protease family protein n=1 Tax=unclassified Marichromatium TaxID=2618417 RepID=UPI000F3DE3A4|nr:TIGR02281 family clan AA aspartic protease [Marichromatium sp. AB31]RNE91671.1 TIGR02281 family clan AA aspartic protease [Marichromatium sp. AB31]
MKPSLRPVTLPPSLRRRFGSLLLLAAALTLVGLVGTQLGQRHNPNPRPVAYLGSDGVPAVVLEPNQVDQYVATGQINGHPVDFLVDTGSADVAMPYLLAQRLGLRLRSGGYSKTGNGNVATWHATLERVDVGGLAVTNVKATVLPNMQGEEALLGMSYLKHMEVVLRDGTLSLRPLGGD